MYGTTKALASSGQAATGANATGGATISGSSMRRAMLLALQKVAGRNYEALLTAAGLTRYLTALPAADQSPAATGQEVAQLYPQRLRQGMAVTDLLHLSVVLQDELESLVEQQAAADSIPTAPALRLLQSTQTRGRMIVSGINLQVLATPG
jgi:hypothetical protein